MTRAHGFTTDRLAPLAPKPTPWPSAAWRAAGRLISALPALLLWFATVAPATAQVANPLETRAQSGLTLVHELGCAQCHADLPPSTTPNWRERTPDLGGAGFRYNPAYLFDFLQQPQNVRRHLGRGRMPGFHLTPAESVALVRFLSAQRHLPADWPAFPDDITSAQNPSAPIPTRQQFLQTLQSGLICLTCHTFEGAGGVTGIELSDIGRRLQPDWVRRYLVAPAMFGVAPATMPPQFYRVSQDGLQFESILPQAAEKIHTLTAYLFSLKQSKRADADARWVQARNAHPQADEKIGEDLFRGLNCAACHRHPTILPQSAPAAPPLLAVGHRVQSDWLAKFLTHPTAVRPFGFHPGDGSRMPDFRLTPDEVNDLVAFFLSQRTDRGPATPEFTRADLSAFAKNKTRLLLDHKLACLGCHRLGPAGGRIGPDLTDVGRRLWPEAIYRSIVSPSHDQIQSTMPQAPLTPATASMLANYLRQPDLAAEPSTYLSLIDHPRIPWPERSSPTDIAAVARNDYLNLCASCHGATGHGDGFNARYLPTAPTRHADADEMSRRPDDTLFDGIASGGYALNKHPFMPAWGRTLPAERIQGLVRHLRSLCQCEEPAWAKPVPAPR